MKHQPNSNQNGFTIIELMFATIIFATVMILLLASFLQIGRMFYKGISMARTQDAARAVVDNITDDIRFVQDITGLPPASLGSDRYYFCIGGHRYTYQLKKQVGVSTDVGVRRDTLGGGGCAAPSGPLLEPTELLGPDMQLNNFELSCANSRCTVKLHIVFYGADSEVFTSESNPGDPTNAPDAQCSGGLISSQFCATSELATTVLMRF